MENPLDQPGLADSIVARHSEREGKRIIRDRAALNELISRHLALDKEEENVIFLWRTERISLERFDEESAKIKEERERLTQMRDELARRVETHEEVKAQIEELRHIGEAFRSGAFDDPSFEVKRRLMEMLNIKAQVLGTTRTEREVLVTGLIDDGLFTLIDGRFYRRYIFI